MIPPRLGEIYIGALQKLAGGWVDITSDAGFGGARSCSFAEFG